MHTNKARLRAAVLGCGLAWLAGCGPAKTDGPPPDAPPKLSPEAEELRARYPFESVEGRLAYEANRVKNAPPVALTLASRNRLAKAEAENEELLDRRRRRREALRQLHSDEVEEFIKREGFGDKRMPSITPTRHLLLQGPVSTLPLPQIDSPGHALADDPPVALPSEGGNAVGQRLMPSLVFLTSLYEGSCHYFADLNSLGYAKARRQVAGFEAHMFRDGPGLSRPWDEPPLLGQPRPHQQGERWALYRLELVSLLKHDRPVVYVSTELPRMDFLKGAPTRDLDAFEAGALAKLEAGEDIVAAATLNRVRMAGAVRAVKQCLDCHDVERGRMLGVFSYDLRRDPPRTEK